MQLVLPVPSDCIVGDCLCYHGKLRKVKCLTPHLVQCSESDGPPRKRLGLAYLSQALLHAL